MNVHFVLFLEHSSNTYWVDQSP